MSSGRGGIQAETIILIERLLEAGRSYRSIAKQAGVNRSTVAKLAREQHAAELPSYVRCPGCGGLVIMPCLACRLRKLRVGSV